MFKRKIKNREHRERKIEREIERNRRSIRRQVRKRDIVVYSVGCGCR